MRTGNSIKTKLLALLLGCIAVEVFGQGVVQFRNSYIRDGTLLVDAPVSSALTGTPLDGTNPLLRAALIGGPTTSTPYMVAMYSGIFIEGNLQLMFHPTITTLSWVNFWSGTTPPRADGYVNVAAGASRVVPGVDWGGTALVQMVAWQGNYETWAGAFAAARAGVPDVMVGTSNPLTLTLPWSASSTDQTFLVGLQPFGIGPSPEPGTGALALMGLVALLFFRRRDSH